MLIILNIQIIDNFGCCCEKVGVQAPEIKSSVIKNDVKNDVIMNKNIVSEAKQQVKNNNLEVEISSKKNKCKKNNECSEVENLVKNVEITSKNIKPVVKQIPKVVQIKKFASKEEVLASISNYINDKTFYKNIVDFKDFKIEILEDQKIKISYWKLTAISEDTYDKIGNNVGSNFFEVIVWSPFNGINYCFKNDKLCRIRDSLNSLLKEIKEPNSHYLAVRNVNAVGNVVFFINLNDGKLYNISRKIYYYLVKVLYVKDKILHNSDYYYKNCSYFCYNRKDKKMNPVNSDEFKNSQIKYKKEDIGKFLLRLESKIYTI